MPAVHPAVAQPARPAERSVSYEVVRNLNQEANAEALLPLLGISFQPVKSVVHDQTRPDQSLFQHRPCCKGGVQAAEGTRPAGEAAEGSPPQSRRDPSKHGTGMCLPHSLLLCSLFPALQLHIFQQRPPRFWKVCGIIGGCFSSCQGRVLGACKDMESVMVLRSKTNSSGCHVWMTIAYRDVYGVMVWGKKE